MWFWKRVKPVEVQGESVVFRLKRMRRGKCYFYRLGGVRQMVVKNKDESLDIFDTRCDWGANSTKVCNE